MSKLKYIFKDIRNNWILLLFFLAMNTIMLFFVGSLIHLLEHSKVSMDSVLQFQKGFDNAYMILDHTSEQELQEMIDDEEHSINKFQSVFHNLYDEEVPFFTAFGYDMFTADNGMIVRQQMISENFFDVFAISALKGRIFSSEEYKMRKNVIPVIVGYELQDEYKLGEKYEFDNGGDGTTFQGEIVGVLKKNSVFYELSNYQMPLSLDRSYIIPMTQDGIDRMSLSDLDMATTRMVLFGNRDKIQRIFSLSDITSMDLRSVDEQVNSIIEEETTSIERIILITAIILSLTLVITWIGFNRLFKKNLTGYFIHIFCGAQKHTIFFRFMTLCFAILIIAWAIVCCIYQEPDIALHLLYVVCFLLVVIGIYPMIKVKKEL